MALQHVLAEVRQIFGMAELRGALEPLHRLLAVLRDPQSLIVDDREIAPGARVVVIGDALMPQRAHPARPPGRLARIPRSEERRVGKGCVSPFRSRGSPY